MSDSDSDLNFESADEDADFDVQTKNSCESREKINLQNHENACIQNEDCKSLKCIAQVSVENDIIDNETIENREAADLDSCSNEKRIFCKPSTKECTEVKDFQNTSEIQHEYDNFEINSNTTLNKTDETDASKIQDKQRVTLRLEKKMQKRSNVEKQNSSEKELKSECFETTKERTEVKQSSWGFSTWGTNLLSTAASSVTTFTSQVSQGIGTVLETVENTLGAPAPEELASALNQRKQSTDESSIDKPECENPISEVKPDNSESMSRLLPNVSSWTKVLENTGSKVIMGGLDTLELIGKKTIDIITEKDPGLRKTRSVFSDGITLSQILREAKAEADVSKEDSEGQQTIHYSQMFDEYQGLVHLEALEMLSTQSQAKLQMLLARFARTAEIKKNIEEIKSICENIPSLDDNTDCEGFEDFVTVCKKYVLELNLPFNIEHLIRVQKRISDVVKNYESVSTITSSPEEIYQSAICTLAEFTAKSIETFHKLAELILVQPSLEPDVEHFATNLTGLTTVMCIEINNLSSRYHHCLDSIAEQSEEGSLQKGDITTIVTNLYVEASNSNKYIQDAFLLLVPVLQVVLLESSQ